MDDNYLDFGVPLSFGYTAQYLPQKSVTRRDWKDSHALKFVNACERAAADGKKVRIPAIDKAYHKGGKQIGWAILSHAPYKETLKDMPRVDLVAEGGMCNSVKEFAAKYFKGDLEKEVWVIGFRFQFLEGEALLDAKTDPVVERIQNPSDKEKPSKSRNLEILTSSKSDEHFTPMSIIQGAREVLGTIELDPMSCTAANKTVRAAKFYDKETDGLTQSWSGKLWLNPAFPLANEATAKLLYHYLMGDIIEALLLLKATPDTGRHQSLAAFPFCEVRGRVRFTNPESSKTQAAPFPVLIFYLGKDFEKFRDIFGVFGNIRLGANQVNQLENDRRDLLAKVAQLQLELAKKSELGSDDRAEEPAPIDWLERDLTEQAGIAESRLQELEIDREVLPDDLYVRQRVEWQARLQALQYTQTAIAKINIRFTEEYKQLLNREHSQIESEKGYTPDFAPRKWVESSAETGSLLIRIENYRHTSSGWIAECNVRRSDRVQRDSTFLIKAGELFSDFHPWDSTKRERDVQQPIYSLGSIRTAKGLRNHFPDIVIPSFANPDTTEIRASDGSIWQAHREGYNARYSIKWRCEVLPDGFSRSPRISTKNDRLKSVVFG